LASHNIKMWFIMPDSKKTWDPDFLEYMKEIVEHKNYDGMPDLYKKDGEIRWVATGNSRIGKKRRKWWREKAKEVGIKTTGKWLNKVAREIHPTGKKPCQICGRVLSIHYCYPNKTTIRQINEIDNLDVEFELMDLKPVDEVLDILYDELGDEVLKEIKDIFGIPDDVERSLESYKQFVKSHCGKGGRGKRKLSPGAMSNAPDRLDGFHTYNLCCRRVEDTGRHDENMKKYVEDRRAYKHWAEGNWKAAEQLMGQGGGQAGICEICGNEGPVTADHIGPISLGFSHIPIFQPLCSSCNSAKNNRFFPEDIEKLKELEKEGHKVVSWHAKYIWDKLKRYVSDDKDAKELARALRDNHHHVLEILYRLSENGYKDFLINYLSPEYAYYDIEFINLDKSTFTYDKMKTEKITSKNHINKSGRYVRIAFEALEEYYKKENRIWELTDDERFWNLYENTTKTLANQDTYENLNQEARDLLNEAFTKEKKREKTKVIITVLEKLKKEPTKNEKADSFLKGMFSHLSEVLSEYYDLG